MGIFNRQKIVDPPKEKHEHIYKDFPWYMEVEYDGGEHRAAYKIIEPYVCITCGDRINKTLEHENWSGISAEGREKEYAKVHNRYKKYLKPRAVVEDMINNVLLVKDPGRLDLMEKFFGVPHRGCGTSAILEEINNKHKPDVPKIELEDINK